MSASSFPHHTGSERIAPRVHHSGRARKAIRGACLIFAIGLLVSLPAHASAAAKAGDPAATLPDPLTREAVRELVARLSDQEVRQLLVTHLDKIAAADSGSPKPEDGSSPATLAREADLIRVRLVAVFQATSGVPGDLGAAVRRFSAGGRFGPLQLPLVGVSFAVLLAIGWAVERLVARLLADIRRRLEERKEAAFSARAGQVLLRLTLDLLLLLVCVATIVLGFFINYQGHEPSRELFMALLVATIQVRVALIIARLLLAPRAPEERLLPFADEDARSLYRGTLSLVVLSGLSEVLREFLRRWGVPLDSWLFVMTLVRLPLVTLLIAIIWRQRTPIAALIRGAAPGPLRRVLADLWPALMTAYVLVLLLAATLEQLAGMRLNSRAAAASLLMVIALPLVDMLLCRLVAERRAALEPASGGETAAGYLSVLRRGVHILVSVGGLLLIARLWDIDLFTLAARSVGARFVGALIDMAVIVLLAWLAWEFARTAIDRRLARERGPRGVREAGEIGETGVSRLATLLPLARAFLLVTVCVMATMTGLAAIGVNIGPLLAGAGVIGLAVGFGSQALVRDIISGAFYLVDDAFRLGEYIDVGDAKGTVERIGIRSMQLRHHRGSVNIVPYGQIRRLNNQSRDWVIEKLEFRLTYDTDLTRVRKILKRIGQEMMQDPEIGPELLQPLKSQGVMAVEDGAMVVRAKFMARPGNQFVIRREAFQRIKQAFDEAGIQFARSQVAVVAPSTGARTPGMAGAAGGAVKDDRSRSGAQ